MVCVKHWSAMVMLSDDCGTQRKREEEGGPEREAHIRVKKGVGLEKTRNIVTERKSERKARRSRMKGGFKGSGRPWMPQTVKIREEKMGERGGRPRYVAPVW